MKDINKALVDLACESDRSFIWFLIGWMGENHHQEMANAARAHMEAHAPKLLAEFDEKNPEKPLELSAE